MEFTLPDIGEGLAEAEIVRWLVEEGAEVEEDQPIVEVETDKAVVEIPAPRHGVLERHGAPAGTILPIGALLAVFADGDSSHSGGPSDDEPSADDQEAGPVAQAPPPGRILATPSTRGLARELGVDISTVSGSGPGGRIVDEDIRRAHDPAAQLTSSGADTQEAHDGAGDQDADEVGQDAGQPRGVAGDRREPMRGLRRTTAARMVTSWREVPHVNSVHEVDLQPLLTLRDELREAGTPVPLTAFLVKATAQALVEWPSLNASVDGDDIVFHDAVNLAVAVESGEGLLVPVLAAVNTMPVARIGNLLSETVTKAQSRKLAPGDLRGATFTVNNYGPLGGWFGTSLVSPGQVGILSLGPARDRVVPVDGQIVIRPVAVLTLAADHRAADGRELIGFCVSVRERLEAPLRLLVEG